jgi:hypothetical protein
MFGFSLSLHYLQIMYTFTHYLQIAYKIASCSNSPTSHPSPFLPSLLSTHILCSMTLWPNESRKALFRMQYFARQKSVPWHRCCCCREPLGQRTHLRTHQRSSRHYSSTDRQGTSRFPQSHSLHTCRRISTHTNAKLVSVCSLRYCMHYHYT